MCGPSRSRGRGPRSAAVLAIFVASMASPASCGLADLRPVPISTYPSAPGEVLPERTTPLEIRFGTAMVKLEAEKAVAVAGDGAAVDGDFAWNGDVLRFSPVEPWRPGTRYALSVSGSIRAVDGRMLRPLVDVPFYAVSRAPAPYVLGWSPGQGASTGVDASAGAVVELRFSEAMDALSVERSFSLDGGGDLDFSWTDGGRIFRAAPKAPLRPWTVYRWSLSAEAASLEGAFLARAERGSFSTDSDRVQPRVARTFPMVRSGPDWIDAGGGLDGLDVGEAVGIDFSKAMKADSLASSIRLEPALAGRVRPLAPDRAVFVPDQDLAPGTRFRLLVSADAVDASGLRMREDYVEAFAVGIPYLEVAELRADGTDPWFAGDYGVRPAAPDGLLALSLRFSAPLRPEILAEAAFKISLEPFFPASLPAVALRSARPLGNDGFRLEWEGLSAGTADERHFYRLVVAGGRGGISNGAGLYLEKDAVRYLEALP